MAEKSGAIEGSVEKQFREVFRGSARRKPVELRCLVTIVREA